MQPKRVLQLIVASMALFFLAGSFFAVAASNTIPESGADQDNSSVGVNDLKPDACGSIGLNNIVDGETGTANNDLQLGSAGNDAMFGLEGDDCIMAGDGDDSIDGGDGTDVCIGGDGSDTFVNCETTLDP